MPAPTTSPGKPRERYGELAANQVLPHLGDVLLNRLKPDTVRAWHARLLEAGLSPRTILHAHRVLCLALEGTQARSALSVRMPRIEAEEVEILSDDDVSRVLMVLQDSWLLPIAALALDTGMRRGELLGLQWGDVNLEAATLQVERSVEETNAGLRMKAPKTKRGRRQISLSAETVAMLRAHKIKHLELRLQLGLGLGKIEPDTLLFGTIDGGIIRPRNLTKAWSRAVLDKTFHALRHTHASMLINAGIDILTVSRRLGHSKAAITLDVYGHLMPGADRAAADAVGGVLK